MSTTQKYLGVNYATAREFVEAIAIRYQRDESPLYVGFSENRDRQHGWSDASL